MAEESNWSTPGMREYPFWRNGMGPDEFDKERDYYLRNFDLVKKGLYKPLWKQSQA